MTDSSTRFRLRDLAVELDLDTDDVIGLLQRACSGHTGRAPRKPFGASTVVGQSLAGRIRTLNTRPAPADTSPAPASSVISGPTGPSDATTPAPAPPQATSSESVPPTAGLFLSPGEQPVVNRMPAPRPAAPAIAPQHLEPAAALLTPPAQDPPEHDLEWRRRGLSGEEQARWITAGLRPTEAVLAEQCRSAEIEPEQLSRRVSGQTALSRLRGGEPATSVWARLREGEDRGRGPGRLKGWMA